MDFDSDPEGILKKEKHFQQTVFHEDFKSAVKIMIWPIWNFCFSIDLWEVQGKARPPRSKLKKLKMMTIEAQDSSTTWTGRRISIFLFFVISVQAIVQQMYGWDLIPLIRMDYAQDIGVKVIAWQMYG